MEYFLLRPKYTMRTTGDVISNLVRIPQRTVRAELWRVRPGSGVPLHGCRIAVALLSVHGIQPISWRHGVLFGGRRLRVVVFSVHCLWGGCAACCRGKAACRGARNDAQA